MTWRDARMCTEPVAEAAAGAATSTPGVAFLRPGLAELIRGSAAARSPGAPHAAGVRVRRRTDPERWDVQLYLAVLRGHRAVAVTRSVRSAVEAAVRGRLAPGVSVHITVTVTDIA